MRNKISVAGFAAPFLLIVSSTVMAQSTPAQTPAPQPPGWQASLTAVTQACKAETPKLCPGLSAETAVACLQTNIDKLTPGCKDAVTKAAKSAIGF